jgi:hypothetical protein
VEGAKYVSELISAKQVERLGVENCLIELQGASSIISAIEASPNRMQLLNISGNDLGNAGVKLIALVLPKLARLSFETNEITGAGTKCFPNFNGLISLNLYGNSIGDKGVQEVSGKVKLGLRKLILEKCEIGDNGAMYVSHAISKCETIQLISLSKSNK